VPPHPSIKETDVLESLVLNLETLAPRTEMLEGEEHLVVPLVAIMEGVWPGSDGPLLYLNEQIAQHPAGWDHKPIVVFHPTINGKGVTACDPAILNTQKIGIILNSRTADKKLKQEAWLNKAKTAKVDQRILDKIAKGEKVEVSTGVYVDQVGPSGVWNGKNYKASATNLRPDHLAILPDGVGACSVKDGAGLLQNSSTGEIPKDEVSAGLERFQAGLQRYLALAGVSSKPLIVNDTSLSDIHGSVCQALYQQYQKPGYSWNGWVEDVYADYFVFYNGGKLYRQSYSMDGSKAVLSGEPVEVVRVVDYQPVGSVTGNRSSMEANKMDKKTKVDSLIANSGGVWAETDREWLMGQPDDKLDKFAKANIPVPVPPPAPVPVANTAPVAVPTLAPAAVQPQTVEQFIATQVPVAMRPVFNRLMTQEQENRVKLIGIVQNAPGNRFTKEQLEAAPTETLEGLAALIPQPTMNGFGSGLGIPLPNYGGAAGAPPVTNNAAPTETLPMPVMNFAPPTQK
jgi:hypothetical protein